MNVINAVRDIFGMQLVVNVCLNADKDNSGAFYRKYLFYLFEIYKLCVNCD